MKKLTHSEFAKFGDDKLVDRFEFYNAGHALEILAEAYPEEWREIQETLQNLEITDDDITSKGGNESRIPKKIDDVLYP